MNTTPTTGCALRRARELSDLGERRAAQAMHVDRTTLRAWESDELEPDPEQVRRAVVLYGADLERIWPDRQPLVTDAEPGVLVVGDERIRIVRDDHSATTIDNHTVLGMYLAAVRRQRRLPPDAQVELRSEDISCLASVLDLDDIWLEAELTEMLQLTPAGARWTMRAMFVGTLMSVAALGLGGVAPAPPTSSATAPEAKLSVGYTTEQELDTSVIEASAFETEPAGTAPVASSALRLAQPNETAPFSVEARRVAGWQIPSAFGVEPSTNPPPVPPGLFTTQPHDGPWGGVAG